MMARALIGDSFRHRLLINCRFYPASPETVAAFIDAIAISKAPASVRRYASSVAEVHRGAKLPNPCDANDVRYALKRMHNTKGRAQRQAAPITDQLVVRMLGAAGASLRDLRNKALLCVAYTTLCRRAELVELLREDLQVEADGFGTVTIRRSKTDQEGVGAVAPVTADAMRHLSDWIRAAKLEHGPLFRAVLKGSKLGGALVAGDVARIFKTMALRAGLKAEDVGPGRAPPGR
jgi:integrase